MSVFTGSVHYAEGAFCGIKTSLRQILLPEGCFMKIWKPKTKAHAISENPPSETDPQGSWTGRPVDEDEIPVQDADDL